jgi:peroxiredoxin
MGISKGDSAPLFEALDQHGNKVKVPGDVEKRIVLMFMRYLGCPLCLKEIGEVRARIEEFRAAGAEVIVVIQSSPKRVQCFSEEKGLPFALISDQEKRLYKLYDVQSGSINKYLTANVLKESLKATLKGKFHGPFEGDEFQIPATFVIGPDGKVLFVHYGKDVADFGKLEEVLAAVKGTP